MMKPTVFLGSTREGIKYAKALEYKIRSNAKVKAWYENVFEIGSNTSYALTDEIKQCDFVVIVMTADDSLESRKQKFWTARDNLIFEAGMGFGAISPERTFIVPEKRKGMKMPSDLDGFTLTKGFESNEEPEEAIQEAADQINAQIEKKGIRTNAKIQTDKRYVKESGISLIESASRSIILFGRDLSWAADYKDSLKGQVENGVDVEVFAEQPRSEKAAQNMQLLRDIGARIVELNYDPGIKFTLIDHQVEKLSRLMLVYKERNAFGATNPFIYNWEIHDANNSIVIWRSLYNIYKYITEKP